jgi:hypothetical protein
MSHASLKMGILGWVSGGLVNERIYRQHQAWCQLVLTCQDGLFCRCDHGRRQSCNPPGKFDCFLLNTSPGVHLVDKTQTLELSSSDRVTRQDEFHGLAGRISQVAKTPEGGGAWGDECVRSHPVLPQGPGKPLGPSSTGNGTDGDLWESKFGIFFSVNDITLATFLCQQPNLWRHWDIIVVVVVVFFFFFLMSKYLLPRQFHNRLPAI